MQPGQQNSPNSSEHKTTDTIPDSGFSIQDSRRASSIWYRASSRRRITAAIIFTAVAAFFAIFAVAAHNNTDMGRWLGYCGFEQRTGLPCPTCGMTTATLAFAGGHIGQAFYIQPAWALICSVMVIAAIFAFVTAVFAVDFRFIDTFFSRIKLRYIIVALAIILTAGWAVTMARALAQFP